MGAQGEKDEEKAKSKQAADVFRAGQAQLRRAQAQTGEAAIPEYELTAQYFTEAIALRPHHALYYLSRGKCYLAIQQYQLAVSDFYMAVRLDPQSAKHYSHRGLCFRRLGRVEDALKDYDEALRLDREKPEYHYDRALVYVDLEQYERAIDGFGQALERKFTAPFKALYQRGICYRKVGQMEASISTLQEAIKLDSSSAEAHNHLGLSFVEVANFEEAKKCFASAVEFDSCARYLNNLGLACYHLGQYDEAVQDFGDALDSAPDDASIHFNRGNARFALGQHQDALADYEAAIELEPGNPTFLHHKALAYQGCGSIRNAISYYEEALKIDPSHHPSRFHLGLMFHLDGQYEPALEAFNGGVPADEALHEARGLVYRDMGDYDKALADFDSVIALEPEKAKHYYNRGVVYHRMTCREQDAIEDLSKALELGSSDAGVYCERGLAWRALGNMAQAVNDLTSAIGAESKAVFFAHRAQCLFEQGLYDRAEMDLSHALALEPRDSEMLYKRGITRYAQRRFNESIADLKLALQLDPFPGHLADMFYHLGVSYANLGKHNFAVPAFDQAVLRGPDKPHYLHERAKSLQVIGEHEKALHDFSRVIDMQPTNARAMFRRSFSFKARGMYEEAAEDFEAAKEFAPDDPRMVVNYRKVYSIACISLGPAGHEDPLPSSHVGGAARSAATLGNG
eukprot:gnl/TRDRNA2_/TRDRNA2_83386_c0_seq1.p1 gnl/TRDRNA2_/TRDRNA2_83386_c0~~gnl/TRDRNA2_/TRDRNA2_83386_c0_seq1.p1  ORF type:complete len:684 (+),score=135.16 gnl/TRDRNA2_/TRDRNA2_83386_c0_seq1:63-2114(+)